MLKDQIFLRTRAFNVACLLETLLDIDQVFSDKMLEVALNRGAATSRLGRKKGVAVHSERSDYVTFARARDPSATLHARAR